LVCARGGSAQTEWKVSSEPDQVLTSRNSYKISPKFLESVLGNLYPFLILELLKVPLEIAQTFGYSQDGWIRNVTKSLGKAVQLRLSGDL
jgi:hypothetical protein